ncbi:putative GPI anchored protein [Aspergillus lucknowensis]|uniref:Uncharacterized protein n=1 Tax=Aspergillus lucknowensis TaxID=176173 RepID=A0ABR4LKM7_9EURO
MHVHRIFALCGFLLLGNLTLAAWINREDVPDMCRTACAPAVSTAEDCDRRSDDDDDDDDAAEIQCICQGGQASTRVPHCEACIAQWRKDHLDGGNDGNGDATDPHDNNAFEILTSCRFTTTTFLVAANNRTNVTSSPWAGSTPHSTPHTTPPHSTHGTHTSSGMGHGTTTSY